MIIGGYTVESVVSESPTALIYKVRHPKLQSVHACKVVPQVVRDISSVRAALLQHPMADRAPKSILYPCDRCG